MKNYSEIRDKEVKIKHKNDLVDDAIDKSKLSKYEIIKKMFDGLTKEIEQLKELLFEDLSVSIKSKEKAEKISKIAFTLQNCLNNEKGKEISENLNWLYRFIRYMSKRIQDNEDMNYVQPAYLIAKDLRDAWDNIPKKHRH